jgi:hypothetical protein
LIFFNVAESGQNGYPGPKGQRGENGVSGPNVNDKKKYFSNFYCDFYCIGLWN